MSDLAIDLQSFIRVAAALAGLFALFAFWRGRATIRESGRLPYLRLRQQRVVRGWQLIVVALLLKIGRAHV